MKGTGYEWKMIREWIYIQKNRKGIYKRNIKRVYQKNLKKIHQKKTAGSL